MSSVTLTCVVEPTPPSTATYQWDTTGCYTHPNHNGGNPSCFPHGQTTQSVTDDGVTAEDAGTITCTVAIYGSYYTSGDGNYASGDGNYTSGSSNYTSEQFTLRISGE